MEMSPTVFLVDGDEATRREVRALAGRMNVPLTEFVSGKEFLACYDAGQPGCLLLELRLPDVGGLAVQRRLAAAGAAIPVVFLTACGNVRVAVHAMRAGAFHFLEKPWNEAELAEVIEQAFAADAEWRLSRLRQREVAHRLGQLTAKEEEVLQRLLDGDTVREIAEALGVSRRMVELRRAAILRKLEVRSTVELGRLAGTPRLPEQNAQASWR